MTPSRIGPYEVERQLGAGAMGAVFQVRDPRLGARYALKAYLGSRLDAAALSRFEREIEALAAVIHPNLVRIHSSGEDQGRPWFLMELVDGEDLYRRLQRTGPVSPRQAVAIARDAARAVAALHARGIVHRDIKPGNLLITSDGRTLLSDLGVVRLMDDARTRLTATGELVGTPAYMAPEQALGKGEVGPPADVWSLGMLLYALLAGRPAFRQGTSPLGLLQMVAQGQIVPLLESAPDVPRDVAVLVAAALRRDPGARPSAGEWADALDAWLAGGAPALGEARPQWRAGGLVAVAALALLLAGGAVLLRVRQRTSGSSEPAPARAERALAEGLGALARAGVAPLGSASDPQLLVELRQAAQAAPPAEARELRGLLGCLLLLEAEGARRRGDEARAGQLLGEVPPDDQVARARLDLLRDLRAAVGAGLPGLEVGPAELGGACTRWPDWTGLHARRLEAALRTGQVSLAVPEALVLLDGPASPAEREAALAGLVATRAWGELAARAGGLGEPWASRVRAWRALGHLPADPRAAAEELAAGVSLPADDPLRRELEAALERVIDATRVQGLGGGSARRRSELWAHVARKRVDPGYELPSGTNAGEDLLFAVAGAPTFADLELGRALVPLAHPDRLGTCYAALMQGVLKAWANLSPTQQEWSLGLCREAYAWSKRQPPPRLNYGDIVDQLGIVLGRAQRDDELRALASEAPAVEEEPERRADLRAKLLGRLAERLQFVDNGEALRALDEAVALRPRLHSLRAERARLRRRADPSPAGREAVLEDAYVYTVEAPRPERDPDFEWLSWADLIARLEAEAGRPERPLEVLERLLGSAHYARLAAWRLLLRIMADHPPEDLPGAVEDLAARATRDEADVGQIFPGSREKFLQGIGDVRGALPAARDCAERGDLAGLRQALEAALRPQ